MSEVPRYSRIRSRSALESYGMPFPTSACGTMRGMCGADAGCLATNHQSLFLRQPGSTRFSDRNQHGEAGETRGSAEREPCARTFECGRLLAAHGNLRFPSETSMS